MSHLELITNLLGPSALIGLGCYQLYLRRNVEKLESQGKVTPQAAIRLRKRPTLVAGNGLILSGTILLVLEVFHVFSN
jgi:hypothetical protein